MPCTKPGYIDPEIYQYAMESDPVEPFSKKERLYLVKKSYQNFYQTAYNHKHAREIMLNTVTGPQYRSVASVFSRLIMKLVQAEGTLVEAGVLDGYEIGEGFRQSNLQMMSDSVMKQVQVMLKNKEKVRAFNKESNGAGAFAFEVIASAIIPVDACLADATYPIYSMSETLCESFCHTDAPSPEEFVETFKKHRVHSFGGALFLLPKKFCLNDGEEPVDYFFIVEAVGSEFTCRPALIWIGSTFAFMELPLDRNPSMYLEGYKTSPERTKAIIECVNFGRNLYTYLATYPGAATEIPLSQVHRSGTGFYTLKSPRPRTTRLLDLHQSSRQKQSRPSEENRGGTHASPVTHWRRGHWRNQVCGERFSDRRMKWIEPVLVNPQQKETVTLK